jgi:hypothetical protein
MKTFETVLVVGLITLVLWFELCLPIWRSFFPRKPQVLELTARQKVMRRRLIIVACLILAFMVIWDCINSPLSVVR